MPIYRVQGPDGKVFRVEAPEGATQEQVLQYAQENYQGASQSKVRGPDGRVLSFPTGTDPEKVKQVLREQYPDADWASVDGPRLGQIESALRQADAAGNTDDARRLAQAYAKERDGSVQSSGDYSVDQLFGKLERADAAGDTEAATVIADEIRRMQAGDSGQSRGAGGSKFGGIPVQGDGPWTKYQQQTSDPREELNALRRMAELEAKAAQQKPDFSNVQGGVQSLQRQKQPVAYDGPLLAGESRNNGPTLDQINAANRATRNAPGYAAEQIRIKSENRRAEFQALPAPARFGIGIGSRVAAAGRGAGQLYAQAADYVNPRQGSLSSLVTGQPTSRYDQAMAGEAKARARDSYMQGDTAAMLGGITGDVGMLMAPGGAVGKLSGLRGLMANAGLGAAYAGLQPVIDGESRATNTGVGAAFGAGGHAVASGVSALGRSAAQAIPAEVKAMAQRARELGIPLHASQVSQSLPVKVAASAGKYLPFSGYGRAATQQQTAINRAVAKTFGSDVPKLTDDAMHAARRKLNAGFEEVYNRNAFPITEKVARKLVQVERDASRRLTNDEGQVLRNQLDDILGNADDGVLTGQKYQAVRTALKKAEGNDKLGGAVKELRQTLDEMAADSVGAADALKLKTLRSQWANFRTAENALKQNAGAGGDVRLAALWPLIRKGSTKDMRELARMGQTILKDPIADSGTAQRTLAYNLLMGGGSIANPALIPVIAKAAVGGATIGRAANSATLARVLTRESRGVPTSQLGKLLERSTPYVAPIGARQYNGGGGR